jgi:hypothetical protein
VTPTQPHPARAPAATAAVLPRGRWATVLEYRGGSLLCTVHANPGVLSR